VRATVLGGIHGLAVPRQACWGEEIAEKAFARVWSIGLLKTYA